MNKLTPGCRCCTGNFWAFNNGVLLSRVGNVALPGAGTRINAGNGVSVGDAAWVDDINTYIGTGIVCWGAVENNGATIDDWHVYFAMSTDGSGRHGGEAGNEGFTHLTMKRYRFVQRDIEDVWLMPISSAPAEASIRGMAQFRKVVDTYHAILSVQWEDEAFRRGAYKVTIDSAGVLGELNPEPATINRGESFDRSIYGPRGLSLASDGEVVTSHEFISTPDAGSIPSLGGTQFGFAGDFYRVIDGALTKEDEFSYIMPMDTAPHGGYAVGNGIMNRHLLYAIGKQRDSYARWGAISRVTDGDDVDSSGGLMTNLTRIGLWSPDGQPLCRIDDSLEGDGQTDSGWRTVGVFHDRVNELVYFWRYRARQGIPTHEFRCFIWFPGDEYATLYENGDFTFVPTAQIGFTPGPGAETLPATGFNVERVVAFYPFVFPF